jgi:hypothetical protein
MPPPPPLTVAESARRGNRTRHAIDEEGGTYDDKMMNNYETNDGREDDDNDFVVLFDGILSSLKRESHAAPIAPYEKNLAAIILREDRHGEPKLYCRESQISSLSRGRYFVQMLRLGLGRYPMTRPITGGGVPLLIKHDDGNGCHPNTRTDRYDFPRLTWSMPAADSTATIVDDAHHSEASRDSTEEEEGGGRGHPAYSSSNWCSAVGMPSYKIWKDVNKNSNGMPTLTTIDIDKDYPWNDKIPLAIWRGSTTCNNGMYGHLPFWYIPRSRLVRSSLDRPDLIDAGYHKLVGKYANLNGIGGGTSSPPVLKDAVPLHDMMRYKGKSRRRGEWYVLYHECATNSVLSMYYYHCKIAIIDIDGNNWSARFPSLMCTNSVIIKITPDFVDQYSGELVPNVHYVPSSLDNITDVVEYVLDRENDGRMRNIVDEANRWCRRHLGKESFAIKAMRALDMYRDALQRYGVDGWESPTYGDMVECDV